MRTIPHQLAAQLAVHTSLAQHPVVGPPRPVVFVADEVLHAAPAPGPLAGRSHAVPRATFRAVGRGASFGATNSQCSADSRIAERVPAFRPGDACSHHDIDQKWKAPAHREIRRCMQHGKNHAQCRLSLLQWNAGGNHLRLTQLLTPRCFSKRPVITAHTSQPSSTPTQMATGWPFSSTRTRSCRTPSSFHSPRS